MDFAAILETITSMLGDVDVIAILDTVMAFVTELLGSIMG